MTDPSQPDAVTRFSQLMATTKRVSTAFAQSGMGTALQEAFAQAHGVPAAPDATPECIYFVPPPALQALEVFWLLRQRDDGGGLTYVFGYGYPAQGVAGDELLLNGVEQELGATVGTSLLFRLHPDGRAQMGLPNPATDVNSHVPLGVRLNFLQLALREPALRQRPLAAANPLTAKAN